MAMYHMLKIRTSIDIFKNEKCKVIFGLEYISMNPFLQLLRFFCVFYQAKVLDN